MRKLGLERDIDLALHLPLRYEDETQIVSIASPERPLCMRMRRTSPAPRRNPVAFAMTGAAVTAVAAKARRSARREKVVSVIGRIALCLSRLARGRTVGLCSGLLCDLRAIPMNAVG